MELNSTAKPTSAQYRIVQSLVKRKILLEKADKLLKDVQSMFENEPELLYKKIDVQNVLKHFDDSNDSDNIIKETVQSTVSGDIVFPIHFATSLGDVEMVRFMLAEHIHLAGYKKKSLLTLNDNHDYFPIDIAIENKSVDVVKLLLEHDPGPYHRMYIEGQRNR